MLFSYFSDESLLNSEGPEVEEHGKIEQSRFKMKQIKNKWNTKSVILFWIELTVCQDISTYKKIGDRYYFNENLVNAKLHI